jgi:hypothetical protein
MLYFPALLAPWRGALALALLVSSLAASRAQAQDVQVVLIPPAPGAEYAAQPPPPPPGYWSATGPSEQAIDYEVPPTAAQLPPGSAPPVAASSGPDAGLRVLAEIGGWSLGLAATVSLTLWASEGSLGELTVISFLGGYFILTPALVYGAGNLAGGHGSFGWTLLANAFLSIFGAIGAYELSNAYSASTTRASAGSAGSGLASISPPSSGLTIPLGAAQFAF